MNMNDTILSEPIQMKVELAFFNKSTQFDISEVIKTAIIKEFSSIEAKINLTPQRFYLSFYEKDPNAISIERALSISNEPVISLMFAIGDEENRDKHVAYYSTIRNKIEDPNQQYKTKMIIISNNITQQDRTKYPKSLNIFFLQNKMNLITTELQVILQETLIEMINQIKSKESVLNSNGKLIPSTLIIPFLRAQEFLQIGVFNDALAIFDAIQRKLFSNSLDYRKAIEYKAITLFLIDNTNKGQGQLQYNREILSLFNDSLEDYFKKKMYDHASETHLRIMTYLSHFKNLEEEDITFYTKDIIKYSYHCNNITKMSYLLGCEKLFKQIGLNRKADLFIALACVVCITTPEIEKMMPYFFNEVTKRLNVYDIYEEKIKSQEDFIKIHKKYIHSTYKPYEWYVYSREESKGKTKEEIKELMQKCTTKQVKPEFSLNVRNRLKSIKNYCLLPLWEPIQAAYYEHLINYCKQSKFNKELITFSMSALQTLSDGIKKHNQSKTLETHISNSLLLQEKILLNMPKLPILMRIIPIPSDIKFDTSTNYNKPKDENAETEEEEKSVFMYNPWSQKQQAVNYYWTADSFQKIKVQFYNPLKTPILIHKIVVMIEVMDGKQRRDSTANGYSIGNPNAKPICYPSSITIPADSSIYIICKIKPIIPGNINIIGVKYELVNSMGLQYVDYNGNGLYYNFQNILQDPLSLTTKKNEMVSLQNIRISPEIPQLDFKILDDSSKVLDRNFELYEDQYYTFSFLLENKGKYPIDELSCFIYAYKKGDYKKSLDELKITNEANLNEPLIDLGKSYVFNYRYLHHRKQCKIEFRMYYISKLNTEKAKNDDLLIKPYLYYTKSFDTITLVTFTNLKLIPVVSSNATLALANLDKKINSKYTRVYSSSKHYLSFSMNNMHSDKIQFTIKNRNKEVIKEDYCEATRLKEISFVVESNIDPCSLIIDWKFEKKSNCEGLIDFKTLFSLQPDRRVFEFVINTTNTEHNGVKLIEIQYKVINCSGNTFNDLRLMMYLYQTNDDDYITNNQLKGLDYEGTLYSVINELKPKEEKVFLVKVYPMENEIFNTTCLIVDKEKGYVHLCPVSKEITSQ